MRRDRGRQGAGSVEFLDDADHADAADNSSQAIAGSGRQKFAMLISHSRVSLTASMVMLIGAVIAIVAVFLPQLTFRPVRTAKPVLRVERFWLLSARRTRLVLVFPGRARTRA